MNRRGDGMIFQPSYTVRQPDGSRTTKTAATFWIQYFVHGKRMRESSGSTDANKAEKLLKLRTAQATLGKAVTPDMARTRFADLKRILLDEYRMKRRRSIGRIEDAMNHLATFFGDALARDIAGDRVTAYVVARQAEGAKDATINRELAALKRAFRLAEQAGKVAARPTITMLREDNARQGFLTHGEFEQLHAALPADLKDPVAFLYWSGWRVGEMRSLRWRDVDRADGVVRLRPENSKTGTARELPLRGELAEIIRRAAANRSPECPLVFQRGGRGIGLFRKSWASACKTAGLGKILVHDLRRTAVRNLIRAGVSDTVAMSISGHKTRSVFDRYNITSGSDQVLAMDRVGAYLSSQPKTKTVPTVVPIRTAQEQPKIADAQSERVKESA